MTDTFVARQPIIDRHGAVVAYELLFRDAQTVGGKIPDGPSSTAAVMKRVLGSFGLAHVIGSTDGYLNCTAEILFSELLDLLPASRFVLEILEDVQLTSELATRCEQLRHAGFRIALDDVRTLTPEIKRFLKHVDIVKIDWPFVEPHELPLILSLCKSANKLVLAEKIEEHSCHAKAMLAGCDLFQGFFFAKPQLLAASEMIAAPTEVLRVLQLLRDEASDAVVEREIKAVPPLVVQILRLANSGGRPISSHASITSIRKALFSVGSQQLMQWCCLLLYGNNSGSLHKDPLVELVERRSNFMENAARALGENAEFCQSAWLTGLLSLAHIRYGIDAATFVNDLPLSSSIQGAIANRHGTLGALLSIAVDLELDNFEDANNKSVERFGHAFSTKLAALAA